MGPRLFSRGNLSIAMLSPFTEALQWGRGFSAAEIFAPHSTASRR